MEEYKHVQNLMILGNACNKMLREKFNIILPDEKMHNLIEEVSKELTEIANEIFSQEIKFINGFKRLHKFLKLKNKYYIFSIVIYLIRKKYAYINLKNNFY